MAGNPVISTPNSARLADALRQLDFMVSVDFYVTETTRLADVILPAPSPLEKAHYDPALYGFSVRNVANYSPPALPASMPEEWETLLRLLGIVAGAGPDADLAALDDFIAADVARRAGVELDRPEPRLPEALKTPSGLAELAPEPVHRARPPGRRGTPGPRRWSARPRDLARRLHRRLGRG